jgi:hypothetical protein
MLSELLEYGLRPVVAGPRAHKMERMLSELLEYGLRPVVAGPPRAQNGTNAFGTSRIRFEASGSGTPRAPGTSNLLFGSSGSGSTHTHKINACLRNLHFCIRSQYAPNGTTEAQDRRVQFIRT